LLERRGPNDFLAGGPKFEVTPLVGTENNVWGAIIGEKPSQ